MELIKFRVDDDILEALKKVENKSEVIREALREKLGLVDVDKLKPKIDSETGERIRPFEIPCCDVACFSDDKYYSVQMWWCPQGRIEEVRALAKPFTDKGGFRFCVGEVGQGTMLTPYVIEEEGQERGENKLFSSNTHMIPAYVGDAYVWLEVVDTDKARKALCDNTALPCAVRADAFKYSTDADYNKLIDLCNDYIRHYFIFGTARMAFSKDITDEDIIKSMDL